MIRGYIIANPGVHFNYLKRELKLKNGSLAYHLKVLEQAEFIKIEREGMYTRLYPMKNGAYYKGAFNGVRLSETQKKIVRQIRIKPGITQKKIIERTNIKQQTVSRNISALEEKKVINIKRKGRETYCYFNKEIELKDN
jgi:predicted transcriptional regulator